MSSEFLCLRKGENTHKGKIRSNILICNESLQSSHSIPCGTLDFPMVFNGILYREPISRILGFCIMTIEEYRLRLGWSKAKLAREADIDIGTLNDAMSGKRIYKA